MLLSSGQACSYPMKGTHAKYGGLAYSSAYAFCVPSGFFTLEQYALASQLGLSDDGGEYWKPRRMSTYSGLETRGEGGEETTVLVSEWRPFPDVEVRTTLVPPRETRPNWHLRVHRIRAGRDVATADVALAIRNEAAGTGRNMDLFDAAAAEGTRPKIIGNYDTASPIGWAKGVDGAFAVSKGAVGIRALEGARLRTGGGGGGGEGQERMAMLVNADPNSNLVESRTVIPTLQHNVKKGETVWYVSAIYAKPSGPGVPKESYLDGWDTSPELPAWLVAEMEAS